MSTKADYIGGNIVFHEGDTAQAVNPMAPMVFHEPFLGKATLLDGTTRWFARDVSAVGNTTPVKVADQGGGVIQILMTSNDEVQDSGIDFNDQRCFDLAAGLIFECRVETKVVPGALVRLVFGLAGDYNADKDTITESAWFSASASGAISCQTDDTTNDEDESSGETFAADTYHICRIDFTVLADVRFYIDGAAVATGQTFDMSNLSTSEAIMQPMFSLDKASGGGLGTFYIDDIRIWSNASA